MENNKKKPIFKIWWFWAIVIMLIGGITAGSIIINSKNTKANAAASSIKKKNASTEIKTSDNLKNIVATTTSPSIKETEKKEYKIGDTIKVNELDYKIIDIKDTKEVGTKKYNKKTKSNFVIVTIEITNLSKNVKPFDNPIFKLKAKNGTSYTIDNAVESYANKQKPLKQLNPNVTVQRKLVFETTKKSTEDTYTLESSKGFFSNETVDVLLKNKV